MFHAVICLFHAVVYTFHVLFLLVRRFSALFYMGFTPCLTIVWDYGKSMQKRTYERREARRGFAAILGGATPIYTYKDWATGV